jgi:hypothetical protein
MRSLAVPHPVIQHPHAALFRARAARSRRASSFDRSGANNDFIRIEGGETAVLMKHEGAGCVTHLYCGMVLPDMRDYRHAILRCYWDGSPRPSVEVPLGDFFTLAHSRIREIRSALVTVNPGCGGSHGLNAYFPMPFSSARITLENRGPNALGGPLGAFWYHIEYETYDQPLPADVTRFHAGYRQERPTRAVGPYQNVTLHQAQNVDGTENYVALDTVGTGRMVGLVLEIENLHGARWYGEGDDMVFIDGEPWPPSIHGTGTEEIFGGGACPSSEYAGPYSGFHQLESPRYDGLVGMYRWYLSDPIHFSQSLRWSVEHGHANNFTNDYASVAYWYQTPLADLPALPNAADLQPPVRDGLDEVWAGLSEVATATLSGEHSQDSLRRLLDVCEASAPYYHGDFDAAKRQLSQLSG